MILEEARNNLRIHSDMNMENGFLYELRNKNVANEKMFIEIMDSLEVINTSINIDDIKNLYGIIFWFRSWLDSNFLKKHLDEDSLKRVKAYVQITEDALYYLLGSNTFDAFWGYNEYLDGRF